MFDLVRPTGRIGARIAPISDMETIMKLFENSSSYAKVNAQNNLAGRTHYVDDSTLRFHKSRILKAKATVDGLLFYIIESCAADYNNTSRVFRHVIFDITGNTVSRPALDQGCKNRAAAEKALGAAMDLIDNKAVSLAAVNHAQKYAIENFDRIRAEIEKAGQS